LSIEPSPSGGVPSYGEPVARLSLSIRYGQRHTRRREAELMSIACSMLNIRRRWVHVPHPFSPRTEVMENASAEGRSLTFKHGGPMGLRLPRFVRDKRGVRPTERRRDFGQGGKAYSRGPRLAASHEERRHRQFVSVCAAVGVKVVAQSGADPRGLLC
jgi:hypothetical protein